MIVLQLVFLTQGLETQVRTYHSPLIDEWCGYLFQSLAGVTRFVCVLKYQGGYLGGEPGIGLCNIELVPRGEVQYVMFAQNHAYNIYYLMHMQHQPLPYTRQPIWTCGSFITLRTTHLLTLMLQSNRAVPDWPP